MLVHVHMHMHAYIHTHMHPRADAHAHATRNLQRLHVQVGRRLGALGRARAAAGDAGGDWQWVNDWRGYTDARVELRLADVGATGRSTW